MPLLVGYLLLFLAVGFGFIFVHLILGKVIRPARPDPDKLTIYECGEPTIGSAWIQFDLRFYVVALLFVIFDVEVAFFFPWAVVFGKANTVASHEAAQVTPQVQEARRDLLRSTAPETAVTPEEARAARQFAWIALIDILVFFGVLLVGFVYLWKRGDLDWVRSTAAERAAALPATGPPPLTTRAESLVGAGQS
jgi:NADH-quinone oxidoreductase subunit A